MAREAHIHVIDDDEAVRNSLEFMLSTSGHNVTTFASADEFLAVAATVEPGYVLTDIRMPGLSGIELIGQLKAAGLGGRFPVVVITGHGDVPVAVEAMKAGAVDFLEKPFDEERLMTALETCARATRSGGVHDADRVDALQRMATLSGREREVLNGLVAGHPNKVIAFDLGISPRTVEVYRANVMTKMRVNSLSELVRLAMIAGD